MIEHVMCSDAENNQFYVEVRWNGMVFAEVWFERQRGAYASAFYRTGSESAPLDNAPDLHQAIDGLAVARDMLTSAGQPQG